MNTSLFLTIRDEIALEGLEGITFEALWTRLQERDRFLKKETGKSFLTGLTFDNAFKNLVYRIVVKEAKNGKFQFFKLPSTRPPLMIFNRNEHFSEDTGTLIVDPSLIPEDIYSPVKCIQDGDIRGSCRQYYDRRDITKQVVEITSLEKLQEEVELEFSQIVVVASQKLRAVAMLGPMQEHNYSEMKLETYCILEYVVRKRFYGYLNSVKEAMKFEDKRMKNSFYYYRSDLFRSGLLVQFPAFFYDSKRKICNCSSVLYQPRFKPRSVSPIDWKVLEVGNLFVERQLAMLPFNDVKAKMIGLRSTQQPSSTTDDSPTQEQQPSTSKDTGENDNKETDKNPSNKTKQKYVDLKADNKRFRDLLQRYSRVFAVKRLETVSVRAAGRAKVDYIVEYLLPLDRRLTMNDLYQGYSEKSATGGGSGGNDEDHEGEEEPMDIDDSSSSKLPKVHRPKFHQLKRYFVERVYSLIERTGATGCTRVQLLHLLEVPNFLLRNTLKGLTTADLVAASSVQRGRQKVYVYKAKRFAGVTTALTTEKASTPIEIHTAAIEMGPDDRNRRRLDLILEYVSSVKFIDNLFSLRRHMVVREQATLGFKIDMRTVLRLLRSLMDAGLITIRCFRLDTGGSSSIETTAAITSSTTYARNTVLIFHNKYLQRLPMMQEHLKQQQQQKKKNLPGKKTAKEEEDDGLFFATPESPFLVRDPNSGVRYVNNVLEHLLLRSKFHFFAQHQLDLKVDISVTPFPFPEMGRPGTSSTNSLFSAANAEIEALEIKDEEEEEVSSDILKTTSTSTTTTPHIISLTLEEKTSFVYNPSLTRKTYGGKRSKVERVFALYRYLFYLLVEEEKSTSCSGVDKKEVLLPTDWRYHVPKLCRIYTDLKCTLLDVLLYMPVSVFRDVYQITHIVPGLDTLLADRDRQHVLMCEVAPAIRRHLLYARRSLNSIFELMDWAVTFGLLRHFEKKLLFSETVPFELVTSLTFDRPLTPENIGFSGSSSTTVYNFSTLEDFDNFVEDVEVHLLRRSEDACPPEECPFKPELKMHTLLAFGRKAATGRRKVVAEKPPKIKAPKEKRKRKEVEKGGEDCKEVEEKGRGAVKIPIQKRQRTSSGKRSSLSAKRETEESHPVLKVKDKVVPKPRKNALSKTTAKIEKPVKPPKEVKSKSPAGPGRRLLRHYWTREEDAFLLKCRLASILLDPKTHFQTCVSRNVIVELLHEHLGAKTASKDADGCARRLLKFAKKAHIQRIITFSLHELEEVIDAASLRPANRQDVEAMNAAFKEILKRILAHKFSSTEFFLERNDCSGEAQGTGRNLVDEGENDSDDDEVMEVDSQARPTLSSLLANYDILDVSDRQPKSEFQADPMTYYDVHHYVRTNLLLSTLTSIKFALDRIAFLNSNSSTSTTTITTPNLLPSQVTSNLKSFYLRTMYKALKHFPNQRLQETIVRLLDLDLIKRNVKTLKAQQILGAGYRISPSFFQRLTRFYRTFDRSALKNTTEDMKSPSFFAQPFVVVDRNTLFSSLQFAENLSADFIGALDVDPKEVNEGEAEEAEEEEGLQEVKTKKASKRPIEFLIEVPEAFLSVPKEFPRNSVRGAQVSRGLMLSRNVAGLPVVKKAVGTRNDDEEEEEEEEDHEDSSNISKKHRPDGPWNTEMMSVNHIKVCLSRQPRSRKAISGGYQQALELLRMHARTFEPAEFFDSVSTVDGGQNGKSATLLQECLKDFPWTVEGASFLTTVQAKAAVEATRTVRSEGLGLKWEQLLAVVFGTGSRAVGYEAQAELKRFLHFCEVRKLVFAVGIVSRMWVHREQIRFWLVHSHQTVEQIANASTAAGEAKQICFLPKLWKLPDGRADLETLMAIFTAILGHLSFTSPTMDRRRLLEAFEWTLPPVQLDELLDILVTIECVRRVPTVSEKSVQQLQQQKITSSFDNFFASADRDHSIVFLPLSKLSNENEKDVEMIDVNSLQKQQQQKSAHPQEGETCYEAAVDAFSRLTIFYETQLQEESQLDFTFMAF